ARARQQSTGESLAGALVALGALSQESVEKVVREELRTLVRSFVTMQEGEFRFEVDEDAPPPEETPLPDGLKPDSILADLPNAAPPQFEAPPIDPTQAVPRRVLIVSERSALTMALREELEQVSFEVETVSDVRNGIDRARMLAQQNVAFLLVGDLVLPDSTRTGWGGGVELVRTLRATMPGLVAILIGESRHPSSAVAARAAGATGYLTFPDLAQAAYDEISMRIHDFCSQVGATLSLAEQVAQVDWSAAPGTIRVADPLSLLRGLIGELNASESGDVSLLVLRLAAEYFERGALFGLIDGQAVCRGAFGDPFDRRMRGAVLGIGAGTLFDRAIATRLTLVSTIPEDELHLPLRERLGETTPRQVAVLPIIGAGTVYGLLYGDNVFSGRAFEDMRPLEIFLSQAGLSLQNALLRRRIESLTTGEVAA
ncbi:MAG TPA: hypothetical protein VMQ62_06170, partial [Dongiaceae bacterium]|nr:hypothetical protein [Dongiaceae bacterium]